MLQMLGEASGRARVKSEVFGKLWKTSANFGNLRQFSEEFESPVEPSVYEQYYDDDAEYIDDDDQYEAAEPGPIYPGRVDRTVPQRIRLRRVQAPITHQPSTSAAQYEDYEEVHVEEPQPANSNCEMIRQLFAMNQALMQRLDQNLISFQQHQAQTAIATPLSNETSHVVTTQPRGRGTPVVSDYEDDSDSQVLDNQVASGDSDSGGQRFGTSSATQTHHQARQTSPR
jgi:hypothetical protein